MNPGAERLTGWNQEGALGKDLRGVFNIINEETRSAVDSPAGKVLREGTAVNLVNKVILSAKDGTEIPINNISAPNQSGTKCPRCYV
jgi:PAS domain S-box-containing protein